MSGLVSSLVRLFPQPQAMNPGMKVRFCEVPLRHRLIASDPITSGFASGMDLETIITAIVTTLAANGLILGILKSWITERLKQSISHEYDKKMEEFKADLRASKDVEIEKLRSLLVVESGIATREFEFQRAEMLKAIDQIYEALVDYDVAYQEYTSPWGKAQTPERAEARVKALDAMRRFLMVFAKKGMFLPKNIADEISALTDQLGTVCFDFQLYLETPKGNTGVDGWHKVTEGQKKVPDIKRRLEEKFRKLLKTEET